MRNAEISQSQFSANVRKQNCPMMFAMPGLVIIFGAFFVMETSFLFRQELPRSFRQLIGGKESGLLE